MATELRKRTKRVEEVKNAKIRNYLTNQRIRMLVSKNSILNHLNSKKIKEIHKYKMKSKMMQMLPKLFLVKCFLKDLHLTDCVNTTAYWQSMASANLDSFVGGMQTYNIVKLCTTNRILITNT